MTEPVATAAADTAAVQSMGNNKIHFSKEVKQVIDKVRENANNVCHGCDNCIYN